MSVSVDQLSLWTAILGGMLSFFSPCVLPLVPGYLSYMSGVSITAQTDRRNSWKRTFILLFHTVWFVLGFTIVFMMLGGVVGTLGWAVRVHRRWFEMGAGGFIILFGIFMVGVYRPGWINREWRVQIERPTSGWSSLLMGGAFGFGWTPCIGPILGAILTLAGMEQSPGTAAGLLFVYSMSLGIPFLLSALLLDRFIDGSKRWGRWLPWLEKAGGALLIGVGSLIAAGRFSALAGWLTWMVPVLGRFG